MFETTGPTFVGAPGGFEVGGAAVSDFDCINIPVATTVRGIGSRPLVLLSRSTVTIDGTLDVKRSDAILGSTPSVGSATSGYTYARRTSTCTG